MILFMFYIWMNEFVAESVIEGLGLDVPPVAPVPPVSVQSFCSSLAMILFYFIFYQSVISGTPRKTPNTNDGSWHQRMIKDL